jgi:hypothetical protein
MPDGPARSSRERPWMTAAFASVEVEDMETAVVVSTDARGSAGNVSANNKTGNGSYPSSRRDRKVRR